ncbi:MAG: hypothetical protein WC934_13040 [Acidithiobacillus sp.]|jgi:hypothetical protein|uniref:hypothetical protein n=1 Tax=Acidithiobacillus sp. TaxID=1872118 RepID=UPI00355D186B
MVRQDKIIKFSEKDIENGDRFKKTVINELSSIRLANDIFDYRKVLLSIKNIFRKQITSLIHYIIKSVHLTFSEKAKNFWKEKGIIIDHFEYNVEFTDGYRLACNVFVFLRKDERVVEGFHENAINRGMIEKSDWENFLNNIVGPAERSILINDEGKSYNVRINFR